MPWPPNGRRTGSRKLVNINHVIGQLRSESCLPESVWRVANLRLRYNIASTTNVDVIRLDHDGNRELVTMRWGLVPFFWKRASSRCRRRLTPARKPSPTCRCREAFGRPLHHPGFFAWTG